jgi:hypothetical protein
MPDQIFLLKTRLHFSLTIIFFALFLSGCAVEAAKSVDRNQSEKTSFAAKESRLENSSAKNRITIQPNSPADTVRVFYKDLRVGKFREALFLTNLRPAIENLSDAELKDLQMDFAALARRIPTDVEINGEIISGNEATVTAKLPDNETDKIELQQIRLRRDAAAGNNVWTILTLNDEAEKAVKKEGRNYFFNLRIATHEREAKKMLDRIAKAEMVFVAQNRDEYGDLQTLVEKNLLPEDALGAATTGYNYKISLSADRKSYAATAEPEVYGKSGRHSFSFQASVGGKISALKSEDRKSQTVRN